MPPTEKIGANGKLGGLLDRLIAPTILAAFAAGGAWMLLNDRVERLEKEQPRVIEAIDELKDAQYQSKVEMIQAVGRLESQIMLLRGAKKE